MYIKMDLPHWEYSERGDKRNMNEGKMKGNGVNNIKEGVSNNGMERNAWNRVEWKCMSDLRSQTHSIMWARRGQ